MRWACVALLRVKIPSSLHWDEIKIPSSLHWNKITSKSWQKPIPCKNLPSNSSQRIPHKIPPKKLLPANSYQKISPKKFLPKNSSQKILLKNSQKISQKIQKISKILKISDSLHQTWRPKTLSGLFFSTLLNEGKQFYSSIFKGPIRSLLWLSLGENKVQ